MATIKTPGVFIVEQNAFPNSVVEVATSVPAFIGYTQKADENGKPLRNVPTRITSMVEYLRYFGGPQKPVFRVQRTDATGGPHIGKVFQLGGADWVVYPSAKREEMFLLYPSMGLFFANGGGVCYVVSVGTYADAPIASNALFQGVDLLEKEQEPTLVVIPDAVHLPTAAECSGVQQHVLRHCGVVMRDRFAILDIYDGGRDTKATAGGPVQSFRDGVGTENLDFGAAYCPWLETTVLAETDVTYEFVHPGDLADLLTAEAAQPATGKHVTSQVISQLAGQTADAALLNKTLLTSSSVFPLVVREIQRQLNTLPPSAAMAGVYASVDSSRGVWKAPANVVLNSVVKPTVEISDNDQQGLITDPQGRAINPIRSFPGSGVLVWGARTLDANSNDWRYINIRRTMIVIEQSITWAAKAYVFEPNTANTWLSVRSMVENFLTGLWKRGALAGAVPNDAFFVSCGLGSTMTAQDVLDGILRVTVGVAITRPAEFIEITFQQQMQTS